MAKLIKSEFLLNRNSHQGINVLKICELKAI